MSLAKDFESKFNKMAGDLDGESDRAVVIIIAAHLDAQLEELLRLALVPSSTSSDNIFDGVNAPLHNFSNKIDFCYRLGLISGFLAKSLHLIRKIRNEFAHNISGCSFKDNSVRSRVEELYKLHRYDKKEVTLQDIFTEETKSKLLLSSILALGILSEVYQNLASNKPKDPEWPFSWLLEK